jgi:hypothetical protein
MYTTPGTDTCKDEWVICEVYKVQHELPATLREEPYWAVWVIELRVEVEGQQGMKGKSD